MASGARQLWAERVRARFPACPGYFRDEIAERLAVRLVPPGLERQAVEEMARSVIRHQLTDYDSLLAEHTLSREEARQIVEMEVEDWLAEWQGGKA
ncbi:DUF2293 domain-containing protein [Pedomonas mirosovicensis]|uniref:DUF2293 domain-containing protein n=1 Tax=Pedomonas mirosovicensis TaxID=2908641 RepID=UPI002169A48E|nr:DUF2293 domain-containing protein [Pedomonas mirosovicensis]MCH8685550.1 DUF2293 domain-containing protein [Pedomonas mirosovicensis]